jgi:uncharacterized RDD family membrane protein YckC
VKCSKCGYIGFESADRCRNCGYEFSLAPTFALPDLLIRQEADEAEGLDDLALIDAGTARRASKGFDAEFGQAGELRPAAPAVPAPPARSPSFPTRAAASELPLFGPPIEDDTPLITKPSPPRQPLSVRRSTPDVPRLRTVGPRLASLDLGLELDPPVADEPRLVPSERAQSVEWSSSDDRRVDAGVVRRVLATVIDAAILLTVDVAVIYLTMQICGLTIAEFGLLPKGPLVAFLVVQNVGYLVAFTAGGQTLGKMAVGIEVVALDPYDSVDVGRALKRTVAWLVLACPAGLGLLSALISHDHRGLHDRFAGTRVVRV